MEDKLEFNLDGNGSTNKPTKVVVKYGGMGFIEGLLLVFIALKLTGHIAWSWWWVFSPLWIPIAVALCALVISAALKKC